MINVRIWPQSFKSSIKNERGSSAPLLLKFCGQIGILLMIQFTRFTSDRSLTKTFYLENDGELKRRTGGMFASGRAETIEIKTIEDLIPVLDRIGENPNQAVGLGVCGHDQINITTERLRQQNNLPDTISRSKKFFQWPTSAGLMLIDHDIKPGYERHWVEPQRLIKILCEIYPRFYNEKFIFRPSTSSFIYKGNKLLSRKEYSYHLYFAVKSFKHAQIFWKWMFEETIIGRWGYVWVDKAGRMHERTFFDQAVFSPERVIYEAGAVCEYPLEQRLPPWRILCLNSM